jgi:hypothetical protein
LLIANGHARPYFGEKKSSWCNWSSLWMLLNLVVMYKKLR